MLGKNNWFWFLVFGFWFGSDMAQMKDMPRNKFSLDPPAPAAAGESRYLTRLYVSGKGEQPEERSRSESSQSAIPSGFELRADNTDPRDNIRAALKLLTFREQNVLVQFWSPRVVGKHHQLTTVAQPYGVGAIDDRLYMYRKDSVCNFYVVDKDDEEEEFLGPPARVFSRGLPEWTSDLTNYRPKHFPQQECAIHCDLHGYLALPVFEATTGLCVGVIELLASLKYTAFAYEVQQFQRALKSVNLTTKHALDSPTLNVHNERRDELEKIFSILKVMCETHRFPLAQTWAMSPLSSFTSHEQMLKTSCNSFNTRCVGKSCMSTAALPFYVQDLGLWRFREVCQERHLDPSCFYVGRALLPPDSSFCEDVTKLSEEEYPLGSYARMSGLTRCFAIFLPSVKSNDGYVLEFFLPPTEATSLYLDTDPQITDVGEESNRVKRDQLAVCESTEKPENKSDVDLKLPETSLVYASPKQILAGAVSDERKVTVKAAFKDDILKFQFPISSGLIELEKEVEQKIKLESKRFWLKYNDEDDDLILLASDADVDQLLQYSASNYTTTIKIIITLVDE